MQIISLNPESVVDRFQFISESLGKKYGAMDSHIRVLSMARAWRSELRCDYGFFAPAPNHTYQKLVWDVVPGPQTP